METENVNIAKKLKNSKIESLLNGSGVNNIPIINISSNNSQIITANKCQESPILIGNSKRFENSDCILTCLNDKAEMFNVENDQKIYFKNKLLEPGTYCTLNNRPECNMNTSIALMTVNSVQCLPRFPNLLGGDYGTNIIACNNKTISNQNNVLWDNLKNVPVDPWLTFIQNENERMDNGEFRFSCRFDGVDEKLNKYIEHPKNRFHPISNYCANLIYNAHPDVKTVFENDSFYCDCGDFNKTRVKHLYEDDIKSPCSTKSFSITNLEKSKQKLTIPYKCFNIFSPITDITKYSPCQDEDFTNKNSQLSFLEYEVTENEKALIEHPQYSNFVDDEKSGAIVPSYVPFDF